MVKKVKKMTEEIVEKDKEEEKEEKKPIMDVLSERITALKNSEREFVGRVNNLDQALSQARADLIAVRARIDEIQRLINEQAKPEPEKS